VQVKSIRKQKELEKKGEKPKEKTEQRLFGQLLDSDLPAEELSDVRLHSEAVSLVGAGIETTKGALTVMCFHVLDQPRILKRLQKELIDAIPDPAVIPPLHELEKLPYLKAVIDEGISTFHIFTGLSLT